MEKKERIGWIDMTRGYGILFVILSHIIPVGNFFRVWIFSFHVPLFFFLIRIFI